MRHTTPAPDGAARARVARYWQLRAAVDDARREFRSTTRRPGHTPAEARAAADALDDALHAATTVALACLRATCASAPYHGRVATLRRVPPAVERWMAELTRLAAVRTDLLVATVGEPGVEVASAVQVGSRAALWHQPGMDAESAADVARLLPQPRIGVALRAAVQSR